jgi:hypothetical protein
MTQTVESAILAELERAELAARERRLAAQAEADRIVEQARLTAADIAAGLDARVAEELEAFRRETLDGAELEAAAIERELAELGRPGDAAAAGVPEPGFPEPGSVRSSGFGGAVDEVVAAVLGETGEG